MCGGDCLPKGRDNANNKPLCDMIISREKTVFFIEPLTTVWADISTFSQVQIYILSERVAVPYYLVPVIMTGHLCIRRGSSMFMCNSFSFDSTFFTITSFNPRSFALLLSIEHNNSFPMLCGNFIVNGIAFMLYFFFLKLKMLGVDHPFPDSSTPTFIIEPKFNGSGVFSCPKIFDFMIIH